MTDNFVIVPTYKEADNLRKLLPALRRYRVIVVDDDSRDGTERVCSKFKNVKLIVRKVKRGMASASLDGLRSISDRRAKVVFMDADFEHDPSKLTAFFRKLGSLDFVVGVKKGKRRLSRRLLSWSGKQATYMFLPDTKPLHDPMSCFFGLKISSIDSAALEKIRVEPYGKLMIALLLALKIGSKIGEVEYAYGERKRGSSKISFAGISDYIRELARLNDNRFLYFLVIGVVGIPINEGLAALFYPHMPLAYALFAAIAISTVVNFFANHYITFRSRARFWHAFAKFIALTAIITGATNFLVAIALSFFVFYLLANFFGIMAGFLVKYFISEEYVWRTSQSRCTFVR